ncbi:MAG: replicative DNA helicase [Planctomycetaceae bacterium]|jgi:replicative DNA helicase|nr:replicative DNA helicase [Planctomycetaceae bacterium]
MKRSRKTNSAEDVTPGSLARLTSAPPHSIEAERSVIGSILLYPMIADDVVPILKADDFYFDANQRIYRYLAEMRRDNSSIDLLLLVNRLQSADELDAVGGQEYLAEVMQSVPVMYNAVHYAGIVKEKSTLRQLIYTGSQMIQDAYAPDVSTKDLLGKASMQVLELAETQTNNNVTDTASLMFELTSYLDGKASGKKEEGVKTGFKDLDTLIDGLHPGELVIAAARPGMGKTAFALNIAENVAFSENNTVMFVSLEMEKLELARRLVCSRGHIDSGKMRRGFLSNEENGKVMEIMNEFCQVKMFIDDTPGRTVAEIAAVARRLKRQEDLKLLVIDYLSLITPEDANDPRQEQVAKIARRLKILARELHVPILCLAQLNRQTEAGGREGNRPRLSHLRESGAIEQDADVVLFIHREEVYLDKEKAAERDLIGKAKIIVAKQRNGATDDIDLYWKGEWTRFLDPAKHHEGEYVEDFGGYSPPVEF